MSSRKVIKASQVDILLVSRSITLRAMIFKLWNLTPILFVPSHMCLRMVFSYDLFASNCKHFMMLFIPIFTITLKLPCLRCTVLTQALLALKFPKG